MKEKLEEKTFRHRVLDQDRLRGGASSAICTPAVRQPSFRVERASQRRLDVRHTPRLFSQEGEERERYWPLYPYILCLLKGWFGNH